MILKDPDYSKQAFSYVLALVFIIAICVLYFFFGDNK
jgi:hypothetical protein